MREYFKEVHQNIVHSLFRKMAIGGALFTTSYYIAEAIDPLVGMNMVFSPAPMLVFGTGIIGATFLIDYCIVYS